MLTQERRDGLQAIGVGRELPDQAGIRFAGGEADADPVAARANVDASRVRMLHGQGFDVGGLLLTIGLAPGPGAGLFTLVSLALLGLSLGLLAADGLAAGSRTGGWLASNGGSSHGSALAKMAK